MRETTLLLEMFTGKRAEAGAGQTVPPASAVASGGEVTAQIHEGGDRCLMSSVLLGFDCVLAIRHLPPGVDCAQRRQSRRPTSGFWT